MHPDGCTDCPLPWNYFKFSSTLFCMDLSFYLQPVSIFIESIICIIAIAIGILKKKLYGWFIALTFGIYVVYDTVRYTETSLSPTVVAIIFLIATLSMLYVVWTLFTGD